MKAVVSADVLLICR